MHKLKSFIKYIVCLITDSIVKQETKTRLGSILLIRLDAIGDYVLFRNYIKVLKNSAKYKKYKITLVGNIAWKRLAEELDSVYVDNFIWIDRAKFEKNPFYRYKKLKEITQQGYEVVLNPIYSRSFFADDNIAKIVTAKEKIGSIGNLSNIKKWQKNMSDKYYTKLIPAKNDIMFEFYRNQEFFESLLEQKLDLQKPFIKLEPKKLNFKLPKSYAILFIGASAKFRKWDIQNFAKVGEYLKENYEYEIVLCGAPSDKEDAKEFKKYAKYDYVDLVGKTSLLDLLYVIYDGNLMIANETSAPHFAIALEMTNIFVLYNGNHYGRFTPYPKEVSDSYHPIYHPEIEKDLDDYKKLSNSYGYGRYLNINKITPLMVIENIDKVLNV